MYDAETTVRERPSVAVPATVKTLNLALQGGGAYGAFAWGVLDRLLQAPEVDFEGICAAGAGAFNAVVMASGFAQGGREGARKALASFWRRVSHAGLLGPLQPSLLDRLGDNRGLELSAGYLAFDLMTRILSPYDFNPLNRNPLQDALEAEVDFERLRKRSPLQLFLCAVNVRTGLPRCFTGNHLTPQAVMAAACTPHLFQAVEIDGEAYWDGATACSPSLLPLIGACEARDVLVVRSSPTARPELPRTPRDIQNRLAELGAASALAHEVRTIAALSRLVDAGALGAGVLKRMLVHAIEADDLLGGYGAGAKLNSDWEFLCLLREAGRARAERFLARDFAKVGVRSTLDPEEIYP